MRRSCLLRLALLGPAAAAGAAAGGSAVRTGWGRAAEKASGAASKGVGPWDIVTALGLGQPMPTDGVEGFPDEALPPPKQSPAAQGAHTASLVGTAQIAGSRPQLGALGAARGGYMDARLDMDVDREPAVPVPSMRGHKKAAHVTPSPIVEEYDVLPSGNDDDKRDIITGEEKFTEEDLERVRKGDVHKIVVPQAAKPAAAPHLLAAAQQKAVTVETEEAVMQPGMAKMQKQCAAFTSWMKAQDVSGSEIVRLWLGTCQPAMNKGKGGPAYKTMCNSMSEAISPYVGQPNFDATKMCNDVLKVFSEAGIGKTAP